MKIRVFRRLLMFRDLAPWNLCVVPNCLYVNPFADDMKLPNVLYQLPHAVGHEGEIQWVEGENIGRLLGVGE